MRNRNLHTSRKLKNDEFYTQISDIENELRHYQKYFRGKVVYCNCDDPRVSNFTRFFVENFQSLGLKKLISSCYKKFDLFHNNEEGGYSVFDGVTDTGFIPFKGDGDFRSEECIDLLKQSDIVVTNPPFSLFREYVSQLMEYEKKFVIIGNINAITYKEVFPLIRDNQVWLGYGFKGGNAYFKTTHDREFAKGVYNKETGLVKFRTVTWYTNLEIAKRHEDLILYKTYHGNESNYPHYDNYNAINVDKTKDIPMDYEGYIGVPITFLYKYNPDLFEVIDILIPILNGKEIYRRIIIKKKNETKKKHITSRDDSIDSIRIHSIADDSDSFFPAFRYKCFMGG